MKNLFLTSVLSLCGLLGIASFASGQEPVPENQAAAPEMMEYSETVGGDYGVAAGADCGDSAGVCDPCADSCYADCYGGYCGGCGVYGGCGMYGGCGLFPFVKDVASVALTPVHWVAGLLSCGTWADCGCAPLPCRTYSDPCDICGNWVGCDYCGGAGCSACANTGKLAAAGAQNAASGRTDSDYLNYNNVETIHQRKARAVQQMATQAVPSNGSAKAPSYQYNEEVIEGAALPNRSAKKVAAVPGQYRSTQSVTAAKRGQSTQQLQKQGVRQASGQPTRQPAPQNYRNAR